jgi:Zn-dependent protease with chaperone function/uncharacterized tellurite resistance protein B-like protein
MSTDFWTRQDKARKRTGLLVFFFSMAVALLVLAVYFLAAIPAHDETGRWWHPRIFFTVSLAMLGVIGIGSLVRLSQLSAGGSVVADMLGGQLLHPGTRDKHERRVLNIVEEMAIASGVPVPPVYMMKKETAINAFAAGYAPGDAVIGVTRGCVEQLSRDELQGVIAHEFSHILNGDMRLNIKLMGILFGIICLTVVARILMEIGFYSRGGDREGRQLTMALGVLGLVVFLLGWIGVFFGNLIQAAISRQREHLADASAVQFTRNPDGLVGALKKIAGIGSKMESKRAGEASHMFFGSSLSRTWLGLFATHPPIEQRIKLLDPFFDENIPEPTAHAPATQAAAGISGLASTPAAITAQAGTMSAQQIDHAHNFLEALPAQITTAVHEPFGAVAATYAMLLDSDDDIRNSQIQALAEREHPALIQELQRLHPVLADQPSRAKLPLAEMALPALRQLSPAQYAQFRDNLKNLAEADQRIDLFEHALARMVCRHLAPQFGDAPPTPTRRSAAKLMPAARVILSGLARHGSDADASFKNGIQRLPKLPANFTMLPAEQCTLADISRALDKIVGAKPGFAKKIIDACSHIVAHDGIVDEAEYELLRAICDSLGCPLPPLVE